jgi:hypothetical protein
MDSGGRKSTDVVSPAKGERQTPTVDEIAKAIADNLPSPLALDTAWRGGVFDLEAAGEYAEEWRIMARAVKTLFEDT